MSFLIDVLNGVQKLVTATPAAVGAEPALGNPGPGTWFLRAVAGVRSWIQLGALALKSSISNADVADDAGIAWTKLSKAGAVATDVGALPEITVTGAVDFNSINSGLPCSAEINASSTSNAPSGFTSGKAHLLQSKGAANYLTQILTTSAAVAFRGMTSPGVWGAWRFVWDDTYLPISAAAMDLLNDPSFSAMRTTLGVAATAHTHSTADLNAGILPTSRGGTGNNTLPAGFAVSLNEQLITMPQAEKSVAFYETAHGGFNAALLADEFEVTGPSTGPTIGINNLAWSKVNKTGATAADVNAMPLSGASGAINFDNINGGLPCALSLAGASYTNGPPGASSTTGYFLVQGVGRDGLRTQYATDTKFGGAYHRFQTSSASGAWSAWFAILDSSREGVDIQAGSWTLNTSTQKMVRQTGAGTLTLPTASAAYAGFRTTITSNFAGNITIAGTYEYLDPNSTPSYWYNTVTDAVFAVNSASSSGYRVTFDIWCDGVYWYVRF